MIVDPNLQLSPRFQVSDLTISSTADQLGLDNIPPESLISGMTTLANVLEQIWDKYGAVSIISGYRSPEVNAAVGGSTGSKHMTGEALDFTPQFSNITDFWTNIISDTELALQLGEISLKPDQNSIHITLPYWKATEYIQNSPRIKDGSGYFRITGEYGQELLNKFGINLTQEEVAQIIKIGGIGLGALFLGAGVLALVWALRR